MKISQNHIDAIALDGYDKISHNTYINERSGVLIRFYENGFVQQKISYLKEDVENNRVPMRIHSYNNLPAEVCYSETGKIQKITYAVDGKLHNLTGRYNFVHSDDVPISYWCDGKKNNDNVEKIFNYFNLPFNLKGAESLVKVLSVFYRSPECPDDFISIMDSLEITDIKAMKKEQFELLDMTYH